MVEISTERRIHKLENQKKKHSNNPKMVANIQGRIDTLRNTGNKR